MNANVFKIISQLVKKLLHEEEAVEDEKDLINSLQKKGYNLTDISEAFEFIFSSSEIIDVPEDVSEENFSELSCIMKEKVRNRVFNSQEKTHLNLNVQGIIIKLAESDLVTESELEKTIAQSLTRYNSVLDTSDYWQVLENVIDDDFRLSLIESKIPEFKVINAGRKEYIQ